MICPNCKEYTSWRYKRCPHCNALTPQPKVPEVGPERPGPGPMPGTGWLPQDRSPDPYGMFG